MIESVREGIVKTVEIEGGRVEVGRGWFAFLTSLRSMIGMSIRTHNPVLTVTNDPGLRSNIKRLSSEGLQFT
jgi:hypothetical protein